MSDFRCAWRRAVLICALFSPAGPAGAQAAGPPPLVALAAPEMRDVGLAAACRMVDPASAYRMQSLLAGNVARVAAGLPGAGPAEVPAARAALWRDFVAGLLTRDPRQCVRLAESGARLRGLFVLKGRAARRPGYK